MAEWYTLTNPATLDTPALVVYPDRVRENIRTLQTFVANPARLRPHIKTSKSPQVARMMMDAGIRQFKCATLAEAEMLAQAGVPDVLLAYQPVGPKALRLLHLIQRYRHTSFSCLVDTANVALHLQQVFHEASERLTAYIDINVGMNRTGVLPPLVPDLVAMLTGCSALTIGGLHAYDGHLRDQDYTTRTARCDAAFAVVDALRNQLRTQTGHNLVIIAGGTPTFSIHAKRDDVVCSPGTFIYWDTGYQALLPEQPFLFAALVVTRIVSLPAPGIICTDLGHKAIASENPIGQRVTFLNAPDLTPAGHSEEHFMLHAPTDHTYCVGDMLYGVPYHICPTVALHDRAAVVHEGNLTDFWPTDARNRSLAREVLQA